MQERAEELGMIHFVDSESGWDAASVLAHAPKHTFGQGECTCCGRCPFGVRIAERMAKTARVFQK